MLIFYRCDSGMVLRTSEMYLRSGGWKLPSKSNLWTKTSERDRFLIDSAKSFVPCGLEKKAYYVDSRGSLTKLL